MDVKWDPTSTTFKPVTQTADAAVNNASINDMDPTCAEGKVKKTAPKIINRTNPPTKDCVGLERNGSNKKDKC